MNVQLAWALVHFLWQGLAIASILWIALQLSSNAAARYRACAVALALMALAPVATFLWLTPHIATLSGTRDLVLDTADLPSLGTGQTGWLESHATWLLTLHDPHQPQHRGGRLAGREARAFSLLVAGRLGAGFRLAEAGDRAAGGRHWPAQRG